MSKKINFCIQFILFVSHQSLFGDNTDSCDLKREELSKIIAKWYDSFFIPENQHYEMFRIKNRMISKDSLQNICPPSFISIDLDND